MGIPHDVHQHVANDLKISVQEAVKRCAVAHQPDDHKRGLESYDAETVTSFLRAFQLKGEPWGDVLLRVEHSRRAEHGTSKLSDPSGLKSLGSAGTTYAYDGADKSLLERFPSPMKSPSEGRYSGVIEIVAPEFTSLCPLTGQPDFATIVVEYEPRDWCVESKAFKLYLGSFRQTGEFHEACVQRIANDLWDLLDPKRLKVVGQFTPRGGIKFWPTVERAQPLATVGIVRTPDHVRSAQRGMKGATDLENSLLEPIGTISVGSLNTTQLSGGVATKATDLPKFDAADTIKGRHGALSFLVAALEDGDEADFDRALETVRRSRER